MWKGVALLGLIGLIGYSVANGSSNEALTRDYCRRAAEDEVGSMLIEGFRMPDQKNQREFIDECMELYQDKTILEVLRLMVTIL